MSSLKPRARLGNDMLCDTHTARRKARVESHGKAESSVLVKILSDPIKAQSPDGGNSIMTSNSYRQTPIASHFLADRPKKNAM